jgi:hypothetical protein
MNYKWYYRFPFFLVIGLLILTGFTYLTMVLWNHLIPVLFHGPVLTFWQTLGLFILAKLLLHPHGFYRAPGYFRNRDRYHYWRERMANRFDKMTPEEKERFREHWGRHFHQRHRMWDPDEPKTEKTE